MLLKASLMGWSVELFHQSQSWLKWYSHPFNELIPLDKRTKRMLLISRLFVRRSFLRSLNAIVFTASVLEVVFHLQILKGGHKKIHKILNNRKKHLIWRQETKIFRRNIKRKNKYFKNLIIWLCRYCYWTLFCAQYPTILRLIIIWRKSSTFYTNKRL